MQIKELEIENILSIGNIKLSFEESGLVLLDGWNHDDNSHNGAGKSAIFNALSFALFNKVPRKITASDLLRRGAKAGFARVTLTVGSDEYEITRSRPSGFSVVENGVLAPHITQERWESIIPMSYDQFLISMYSSQTESLKLLLLNDSGKKDFFLKLLNLNDFADKKQIVDAKIKKVSADIRELELTRVKLGTKITIYETELSGSEDLASNLKSLNPGPLRAKLPALKAVAKPDISAFEDAENELAQQLRLASSQSAQLKNLQTSLKRIEKTIAEFDKSAIECPHCNGAFTIHSEGSTTVSNLEQERDAIVAQISVTPSTSVDEIELAMKKLSKKKTSIVERYSAAQQEIATINMEVEWIDLQRVQLTEKLSKQDAMKSKLEKAKDALFLIEEDLESLDKSKGMLEALALALSPSGAPAYVVDAVINMFNEQVAQYVSMIWPNADYSLQSFKENKNGDVKAKFGDKLIIGGNERTVGSLSGGELRCLSVATDFAVIGLLEDVAGIAINPIILDEGFEGLDSLNRERVLEVIELVAAKRQVFVIDHASEIKTGFSKVLKVEKKNGVSYLSDTIGT